MLLSGDRTNFMRKKKVREFPRVPHPDTDGDGGSETHQVQDVISHRGVCFSLLHGGNNFSVVAIV